MNCHRCGKDVGDEGVRPPRRFYLREGESLKIRDNLYHPKCVPSQIFHDKGTKHEQADRRRQRKIDEIRAHMKLHLSGEHLRREPQRSDNTI